MMMVDPSGEKAIPDGHHIFVQKFWRDKNFSKAVKDIFDSTKISNRWYCVHRGATYGGITHPRFNNLVIDEYNKFFKGVKFSDVTPEQAKAFLKHIKNMPANSGIGKFLAGVQDEASEAARIAFKQITSTIDEFGIKTTKTMAKRLADAAHHGGILDDVAKALKKSGQLGDEAFVSVKSVARAIKQASSGRLVSMADEFADAGKVIKKASLLKRVGSGALKRSGLGKWIAKGALKTIGIATGCLLDIMLDPGTAQGAEIPLYWEYSSDPRSAGKRLEAMLGHYSKADNPDPLIRIQADVFEYNYYNHNETYFHKIKITDTPDPYHRKVSTISMEMPYSMFAHMICRTSPYVLDTSVRKVNYSVQHIKQTYLKFHYRNSYEVLENNDYDTSEPSQTNFDLRSIGIDMDNILYGVQPK